MHKPHNLTSLAERHTGRKGISYEDLCGEAHQIPFGQVPVDKAAAYSCEDSDQTLDVANACGHCCRPTTNCASSTNWRLRAAKPCTRIERKSAC